MAQSECIFCSIINGIISAVIVDENEHVVVIEDIAPKAPTHLLIVPRRHVKDVSSLEDTDAHIGYAMLGMAKALSQKNNGQAFRLVINNGSDVGQSVLHLHCHYLAGKSMKDL